MASTTPCSTPARSRPRFASCTRTASTPRWISSGRRPCLTRCARCACTERPASAAASPTSGRCGTSRRTSTCPEASAWPATPATPLTCLGRPSRRYSTRSRSAGWPSPWTASTTAWSRCRRPTTTWSTTAPPASSSSASGINTPGCHRSLDDRRLVALPVLIPEQALVQLAGRRPGQLADEVNGPGAFEVGQPAPAVSDQLLLEIRPGSTGIHELHHRLDLFAQIVVGDADDGHVQHGWMAGQEVLGFLGIDVDPTGDDHVALAVGEVQVPLGVDMANIADGAGGPVDGPALLRLGRVLEILKGGRP